MLPSWWESLPSLTSSKNYFYYFYFIISYHLDSRGEGETWAWQQYADAIFPRLESSAQAGALLWNMNCQYASWSMKGLAEVMHVQWNL